MSCTGLSFSVEVGRGGKGDDIHNKAARHPPHRLCPPPEYRNIPSSFDVVLCSCRCPEVTMPRVPLSVVALSTALLMLPGSGEARSLRYALHSAVFAPFGVMTGMLGIRHRAASYRHRAR